MTKVDRMLWTGVVVPPAAWTLHLLLGYALVSLECGKHLPTASLTHVVAILALAAALAAAVAAAWAFGATGRATPVASSIASVDRRRAMGLFGMLSSGLFATGILYAEVGAVVLRACSG